MAPSTNQLPCPSLTLPQQWADSVLPTGVASECSARSVPKFDSRSKFNKRRLEFAQGRACLHGLLEDMGETQKVGSAEDRSPIWPDGFVGSLSHSDAWIWGCVARATDLRSIGVDTETIASREVRDDLVNTIATDAEWKLMEQFFADDETAFTLLFSAKEAFYKCWFPIVKAYFDFFDVELVAANRSGLALKVLSSNPAFGAEPDSLVVEYLLHDNSVFTATWIENQN